MTDDITTTVTSTSNPPPDPPTIETETIVKTKQQNHVLNWLGFVLVIFAGGLVAIGVAGLFRAAPDPQGVNAVREDLKAFVLFILGALTNRLGTAVQKAGT